MTSAPTALRWHLRWLTAGWVMVVLVVLASLTPIAGQRGMLPHLDKLEHALAYLVLMAWFGGLSRPRAHRWIALGLLALGAAVELAQGAGPWRRADWADLAADAAGIALGWLLARGPVPGWFVRVEARFVR